MSELLIERQQLLIERKQLLIEKEHLLIEKEKNINDREKNLNDREQYTNDQEFEMIKSDTNIKNNIIYVDSSEIFIEFIKIDKESIVTHSGKYIKAVKSSPTYIYMLPLIFDEIFKDRVNVCDLTHGDIISYIHNLRDDGRIKWDKIIDDGKEMNYIYVIPSQLNLFSKNDSLYAVNIITTCRPNYGGGYSVSVSQYVKQI